MTTNENLIRIFEYALSQEETGKSFFETSLERMGWGAGVAVFKQLIREEEKHIRFIRNILEGLKTEGVARLDPGKDAVPERSDFFDIAGKGDSMEQIMYESMVPDVTVFSVAWLIEKDLSEYYETMAAKTEGKAKEALTMLADWEKSHERFFREYREKLTEIYAKMPWGG
ncbi:MAG: ferritin family protein [Nitrospiraceae bacterium]|nr:ferritin family protein [Nitrospiraceae bacterium]